MKPEEKPRATSREYSMGHDAAEIRRLEAQGRLLAPMTRDLLRHAGVTTRMRVLDVGCGGGDVAFVVADLVGPAAEIIGFDRADTMVSIATARAQALGLTNVRFVQCDIDHAADLAAGGLFDAVVSRAVLAHLPNPVDALRKLLPLVRPGGVVGFLEAEGASLWSTQKVTIFDEIHAVVNKSIERGLWKTDVLSDIVSGFDEAGITERRMSRMTGIFSARDDDACAWVANMAQTLHGLAQRMGFPLPNYDPKTVAADLKKELVSKNALFSLPPWLGATGRVPAAP